MNEIFRPPRKCLYEALACAVFFAFMAMAWVALYLSDEPGKPFHQTGLLGLLAIEVFWLSLFALAVYSLAAYWREELHVDGARIRFCSVFRSTTVDLSTVAEPDGVASRADHSSCARMVND